MTVSLTTVITDESNIFATLLSLGTSAPKTIEMTMMAK